jgi:prefoldin subunit 5
MANQNGNDDISSAPTKASPSSSMPASKLSYEQLRDIRDQLRRPLTGRSVLVPFGSKAFFPGSLKPEILTSASTSEHEEKVIVLAKNGQREEMTRSEALDFLQKEMDALRKHVKEPPSSLKKKPAKVAEPTQKQSPNASTPAIPYFEIREELDTSGNEIGSEAIDVSQHLEYLRNNTDVVDGDTLPPRVNQPSVDSGPAEEIPVENDKPKPLSDQDFDALSSRLEELAMLEEASGNEKAVNLTSAKKLQSKGWSKGFLNTSQKKAKSKKPKAGQLGSTPGEERKVSFADGGHESPRADPKAAAKAMPGPLPARRPFDPSVFSGVIKERSDKATSNKKPPPEEETTGSRVTFAADKNEIREIPRVGQTSVSTIKKPSPTIKHATPPEVRGNQAPRTTEEQPQQEKKLSRFAMQRQQGLR